MPERSDDDAGDRLRPPTDAEIEHRLRRIREELDDLDLNLPGGPSDEEVNRRAAEIDDSIARAGRPAFPEVPEFDDRLHRTEKNARAQKQRRTDDLTEQARQRKYDADAQKGLGVGMSIAWTLIGLPLLGAGVGWFIDKQTGSHLFVGIGVTLGAVLGVFMAILTINRSNVDS